MDSGRQALLGVGLEVDSLPAEVGDCGIRSFLSLIVLAELVEDRARLGRINGVGGTRGADLTDVMSGRLRSSLRYEVI